MDQKSVLFTTQASVGIVTFNRPQALNAFTLAMLEEMGQALDRCLDPGVRAVVLTGGGSAFCAGADVKEFTQALERGPDHLSGYVRQLADQLHGRVIRAVRRLPEPVIACLNGVAAGAGLSIALACDLRIASSGARFLVAYSGIGGTPDGGSSFYLPRLVGQSRAMDLCMSNTPIGAQQALEMGLVNRVVAADDLSKHTMELATALASGPTLAFGRLKALMDASWHRDLASQLEAEASAITDMARTRDFQEGITAFAQKRPPRFQGG